MQETRYIYQDNLESDRLQTRFLTAADIEAWSEFFKDKETIKLFRPALLIPGQNHAENWINGQIKRYADKRFGLQALIDKSTHEFIGQCGLLAQEIDGKTEIEVGYHVFKKYWGQGYAPEAARLFIDYAFANNITSSLVSIIDIRNNKSQRVAGKNGLKKDKETTWNGIQVYIYRINN